MAKRWVRKRGSQGKREYGNEGVRGGGEKAEIGKGGVKGKVRVKG